ncbi:MAG: DNA cytosine methyltransferase [Bdellovibrionales bacterium]|nr:DNA cytosine methyltransferase [Bdellovibrionales bacterium]
MCDKKNLINIIKSSLESLKISRATEIEKEIINIHDHLRGRKNNKKHKFTFIDLFAGIGGMRMGFESVYGKCVMSSEIDRRALATYFCNFGDLVPAEHRDITKLKGAKVPDHDILLAGFPCQAFSIAGERRGFQDTRGTLFFDIQKIIAAKRPKAFLLENVKGLINHDKGKTFKVILHTLEKKLGYQVHYKILNTMEHGNIPQTRERIYIVGFDKKIFKNIKFDFPKPIKLKKRISHLLEKKQKDDTLFYERFGMHSILKKEITKIDVVYQWRRAYVRENKSNACPTLTANMGTGGHNVPLIKDPFCKRVRKLSPRECANFQGFPSSYFIPSFLAKSYLYKQFGNSVSVPVVQRIAENILKAIQK